MCSCSLRAGTTASTVGACSIAWSIGPRKRNDGVAAEPDEPDRQDRPGEGHETGSDQEKNIHVRPAATGFPAELEKGRSRAIRSAVILPL